MIKSVLLILATVYIAWLIFKYIRLVYQNAITLNTFKKLEGLLGKRYEYLANMPLSEEARKYLDELTNLPKGIKFLNRKLALNYILASNAPTENLSDEYKIVNAELSALGEIYNKRAIRLKTMTEIFPASFYARFMNIKSVDFYREQW